MHQRNKIGPRTATDTLKLKVSDNDRNTSAHKTSVAKDRHTINKLHTHASTRTYARTHTHTYSTVYTHTHTQTDTHVTHTHTHTHTHTQQAHHHHTLKDGDKVNVRTCLQILPSSVDGSTQTFLLALRKHGNILFILYSY